MTWTHPPFSSTSTTEVSKQDKPGLASPRQTMSRSQFNRAVGKQLLEDQSHHSIEQSNVDDAKNEAQFYFELLFGMIAEEVSQDTDSKSPLLTTISLEVDKKLT